MEESIADKFIDELQQRLSTLSKQPYNRIYYRIKGSQIEVINMYDTRSNPKKNRYL
jgi:hypothetical protein